ncbi:hypothetical protein WR25_11342 [Diploscapter pachys]|uniref:Uncharacterized protein n=1 Tax=Diploscapter pachys TaxID=2018661 RepID=A0A2A2KLW4_9BILA|nr:hypothetical protein WR25_11342 [Diploscapter pachys]
MTRVVDLPSNLDRTSTTSIPITCPPVPECPTTTTSAPPVCPPCDIRSCPPIPTVTCPPVAEYKSDACPIFECPPVLIPPFKSLSRNNHYDCLFYYQHKYNYHGSDYLSSVRVSSGGNPTVSDTRNSTLSYSGSLSYNFDDYYCFSYNF